MIFSGRLAKPTGARKWGLAIVFAAFIASSGNLTAKPAPVVLPNTITSSQMPAEARSTLRLVRTGGPFPYSKDGMVFANRERSLPQQPRGFYREYTVTTPGAADRGARRIVCGGYIGPRPQTCFYTGDHYASFRQILE